jgi:hypothetical protein
MQVGSLKKLPDDFVGERHVVVVKRQQTCTPNYESCLFEERPWPGTAWQSGSSFQDLRGGRR